MLGIVLSQNGEEQLVLRKNLKGILWILMWALVFTIIMSLTKFLETKNTVITVFTRLIFGSVFLTPFVLSQKWQDIKTRRLPLHALRAFFACSAMLCTYYAYQNLPLAFATSIGFTAPLITTVLAIIVLKEIVTWDQWLILILGYLGVLVIVHPSNFPFEIGVVVAIFANVFASSAIITAKRLTATESTVQIMFYLNILSLTFISLVALFFWTTPSLQDVMLLMGLGALATLSHFCSLQALKNSTPSVLAPFEYSRFVFAIPIGILFLDEWPSLQTIIGSLIIVVCNLVLTIKQTRLKERQTGQENAKNLKQVA